MSTAKRLGTIAATLLLLGWRVCAQEQNAASQRNRSTITVTANATTDRIRFTAPSTVVQIRLEVYAANGEKLFDNEIRGGNVIDWRLQDGRAERLAEGAYLCVVTLKTLSGQMAQKLGGVIVEAQAVRLATTEALPLTPQQAQSVGPVEAGARLTILHEGETETPTVIAHDGEDGLISRGRGALSFRLGDFYSGKDTEQMRLTTEGNLGIGIAHPKVRLEVDGLIRTTRGIVFPDGTVQTTAALAGNSGQTPTINLPGRSDGQTETASKAGKHKKSFSPELVVNEDLTINGNIIFTPPSSGFTRDITMTNNNGGLRFFGAPTLSNSPAAAAIQFWGNNSPFPGQLYLDSGAHDNGALIFRTTGTGGTITERMRVTSIGNLGIGTNAPLGRLQVVTASDAAPSIIPTWDARHFVIGGTMNNGGIGISYDQANAVGYIEALIPNSSWRNLVLQSGGGNIGMGTLNPSAKLSVVVPGSNEIAGAAMSSTFRTTAGSLGSTPGDELSLASIGFLAGSGNNSSLGIRGRRITAGNSWTTSAIGLGMDVDNTVRAGDATVWLHANGNVGIGQSNPTAKLTVEGTVQSNSGGFKFPDGSVQTVAAANTTYTTAGFVNMPIPHDYATIIHLNLPTGIYLLSATLEFENGNNDFGDNSREVECQFSGDQTYLTILAALWLTQSFHSVLNVSSGGVDFRCAAPITNNPTHVGVAHARLTAVKLAGNVVVQ